MLRVIQACSEGGCPMSQHPNAGITSRGRETLISRVAGGERVSDVARQMGLSRQTASKWVARARRGEPMSDRGSRPVTPVGNVQFLAHFDSGIASR
ncbi:helix-turn-helix domain-containing protein [Thermophilibacter sp.]|uniref:helix-turn-helix domain-containing protein n=1 Tax=Thermophilibacter sp. TaxID=2847309 RepID=UPI003A90C55D